MKLKVIIHNAQEGDLWAEVPSIPYGDKKVSYEF